jgi:hypothetical protein
MKTKRTLLVAGALTAIVLSAPRVNAVVLRPLVVINPAGTVRIQQALPCRNDLDTTRPIAGGRIDITPSVIPADVRQQILFQLTRMDLFLAPFSVHRECRGIAATAEFFEIGVRLARAVIFTGEPDGPLELRRYSFTIPKEQFLIFESILDNAPVRQPETMYQKPSEDVTGLIDLGRGAVEIHVALASRLRFRAGCTVGNHCLIDEQLDGMQRADVAGIMVDPAADSDGDRVPDLTDNCPLVANPTQAPVPTPVLTPPPNVTLNACQDHNIGTAQANDVCHARPVVITNNAPAKFAIGPNLVTWSANDGIDPIVTAQQTVTISAVDTTPPTVACLGVPPPGGSFRVSAADDCGGRLTIRLGTYRLANGEVIQIQETGQPGVRLIGTVGGNIRHFQVGKGQAIITATDASGNSANAACR